MTNDFLTVSGKMLQQTITFRMALPDYQRVVEVAQRNGRTLSELVRQATLAEIDRLEAREARLSELAKRTRDTAHTGGVSQIKTGDV